MFTPAAKRRRIDTASSTLMKPFRSPFKTNKNDRSNQMLDCNLNGAEITENSNVSISEPLKPHLRPGATPQRANPTNRLFTPPFSTVVLSKDHDIAPLLKGQHQLEKQLRELKEELDVAEQARKIEVDSEKKRPGGEVDGELVELIEKWRRASRLAAEELFTGVRDRVNRIGGPKAWKQMQERQQEFQKGWNEENQQEPDSDDEDSQYVEKRDLYAEYGIDAETANEKKAREDNDVVEYDGADDEFTIPMMLRSLNIPLSAIGYDKAQQRWTE